ncbi:MAG: DUF3761 domain-containing protein [Actinomycetota bacterium]|nr:DUF3761 domain-containing protein [Actinomycetota bacterium]MCL6093682.1 DUF3761 domain-containing protein [Actinomycetota bacterium]MDA8167923.1 DUF3761 domain-containing protein [Actinomycetota bacterium]
MKVLRRAILLAPALLLLLFTMGCAQGQKAAGPGTAPSATFGLSVATTAAPAVTLPSTTSHASSAPAAQPTAEGSPAACDEALWQHIYHPQRLRRISDCVTITGTIAAIRKEADGDYHILLSVDGQFTNMINRRNIDEQHGDLVLEPVCQNRITQEDAKSACDAFSYPIAIPAVGQRVTVTGDYVLDTEHGWNELHPVYSFSAAGASVSSRPVASAAPAQAAQATHQTAPGPQTAAAGATAQCNDGTYSHASTHRGACSHHGGVKTWYR